MRTSKDDYLLSIALVACLRSEDPHGAVGAAVADGKNKILSTGYNGLPPGKTLSTAEWADRDGRRGKVLHAEVNALSMIARGDGHTIACTLSPCLSCAQLVVAHDVRRFLYLDEYSRDTTGIDYLTWAGVEVVKRPRAELTCVLTKFLAQPPGILPSTTAAP
jgi:dCMP deaminase